jgi:uncharacterized secreted protein with C-terminal beta-propeller domain
MGIEVPEGAAPEQPKTSTDMSAEKAQHKNQVKVLLFVAFVALLAVAAILVALLPDWAPTNPPDGSHGKTDLGKSQAFFESHEGPFDIKIPLFSADITEGYATLEEAEEDIEQVAKFLLNEAITSNVKAGKRGQIYVDPPIFVAEEAGDAAPVDDTNGGAAMAAESNLAGATDFETNNQEKNVDKADLAKSDGKFVFAAYGDYLLVWTADTGDIRARIQMPPIDIPEQEYPDDVFIDMPMTESSMMVVNSKPYIESLLLEGNILTVIVTGYGQSFTTDLEESPILWDYLGTHIRVYEINDMGDLALVRTKDVNGSFRNAYSIGNNGYIVTKTSINWDHLLSPIQRWQPNFSDMDDAEYLEAATSVAEDELISLFISRLLEDLQVNGNIDLARLSLFADSISADGSAETSLFAGGVANAVTQVISFDMSLVNEAEFTVNIAATFQPGHWGHVYATDGMIIVADQGWSWIEEEGESAEKTYLIGFRLDGPSSSHALVGSVPGHPLNPYSLDFVEVKGKSYLRIATTESFWSFGITGGGIMMAMEEDGNIGAEEGSTGGEDGLAEVVEAEAATAPQEEPDSSTKNQVFILEIPNANSHSSHKTLKEVGSVTIGKANERITSMRFFDDFAYAVTFERTDPFYVLDLSDPTNPTKVGTLEVTGFSEYLHPIDDENKVLVAVGQDTNVAGDIIGLAISLFNATDPKQPTLIDRLVVENEENSWSSSTVTWDERAFRFLNLGDNTGRVIIPLSIYSWTPWDEGNMNLEEPPEDNNFEGFAVFSVENNKISRAFRVDHKDSTTFTDGCYPCGWLPERSFVFSGDVMTMKGHSVVSTDLASDGNTEWTLNADDLPMCCS